MAWGLNTVFGMKPGYDVKLLESNGRGYESFEHTIDKQDNEMIIAIAGQTVTVDGGTGFSNADIHKTIRADLIKSDGGALAYTINTQGIPQWTITHYGEEALAESPTVEWNTDPPKDLAAEANAQTAVATSINALADAIAKHAPGVELDVPALLTRHGVPVKPIAATPAANDAKPKLTLVKEAA
jgi:phage gp29-like protein